MKPHYHPRKYRGEASRQAKALRRSKLLLERMAPPQGLVSRKMGLYDTTKFNAKKAAKVLDSLCFFSQRTKGKQAP